MNAGRRWHDPDADSLGKAVVLAEGYVAQEKSAYVVCATMYGGKLGFNALPSSKYAELREQNSADHLAPVLSLLPNGKMEIYPPLADFMERVVERGLRILGR